jgi:YHS domain-containing protein
MHGYDVATRDPVCGRDAKQAGPNLQTEYADVIYRFCSQTCMDRFIEQPDIFTAEPGRGLAASADRALRDDDHEGELSPEARAVIPQAPPAADPG